MCFRMPSTSDSLLLAVRDGRGDMGGDAVGAFVHRLQFVIIRQGQIKVRA